MPVSGRSGADGSFSTPTSTTSNHLLGPKVAERVIQIRDHLPEREFTNLHQLQDIRGIGEDKFASIMDAFNKPSSHLLTDALEQSESGSKPPGLLIPQTTYLESSQAYNILCTSAYALRELVSAQLMQLARGMNLSAVVQKMLDQSMQQAFIESYDNRDSGAALALALWLYQFKADDCFPFARALDACNRYIGPAVQTSGYQLQLWIIKPLEQSLLFPNGAPSALPVVGDQSECSVTLWLGHLAPEAPTP